MLKISLNNQPLDLPEDFSFDIEEISPIFNERGSQSLPATVPVTRRNCILLDAAHRMDAGTDPNLPYRTAEVTDGPMVRRGLMNITEAGRSSGITFNIGFDNSTAYVRWQNKKLTELESLPVYKPDPEQQGDPVELLLLDLYRIYQTPLPATDPFAVFPVALNNESTTSGDETTTYWELLNIPGTQGLVQPSKVMRLIGGEVTEVSVPAGYMVSPFVRVWRVLEIIFADLGLSITENPFREDDELALLVVLNNAADAICTGEVKYADILPDCTVAAFMNALWVRFGLVYYIDDNNGTVRLEFLKDILNQELTHELTPYTSTSPRITYDTRQYIHLTAATSLEYAAPATERFEDFTKGLDMSAVRTGNHVSEWTNNGTAEAPEWDGDVYDDYNDPWENYDPEDPDDPDGPDPEETDPDDGREEPDLDDDREPYDEDYRAKARKDARAAESSSFLAREYITGNWYRLDSSNNSVRESSSCFFDWNPQPEGCNALDLQSDDECVPLARVSYSNFNAICPMFLTGARHFHTYIKGSDDTDKSGDGTPLAFMFAYTRNGKTFGRLNAEGEDGLPIELDSGLKPALSLLFQFSDGLFATFWKQYDEILRHGNRLIEVTAYIPKDDIRRMDLLGIYRLHGVRCLIDSMNYSLPAGAKVPVNLKLRTIQTQGKYNINKEQAVPEFKIGTKQLAWRVLSETYGPAISTDLTRMEAAATFIDHIDYHARSYGSEVWFIAGDSAVLADIRRGNIIWQNDTSLPEPLHITQKLTRQYTAILVYDMYELYTWQDNPDNPERDSYLGRVEVEAQYSVTLAPVWVPL